MPPKSSLRRCTTATSSPPPGTIPDTKSPIKYITHKNETLDATSSTSSSSRSIITDKNYINNESFEEIRYCVWLDNSKAKETVDFEAKEGFLIEPIVPQKREKVAVKKTVRVVKKVVRKVSKKVQKEENDGVFGKLGVDDEVDNSNIVTDVNANEEDNNEEDNMCVASKKVVTMVSKKGQSKENDGVLGNLGVEDEVGSSNIITNVNANKEDNNKEDNNKEDNNKEDNNKEDNTSVVSKNVVTEEEKDGVLGKSGVSDKADTESHKKIVLGSNEFRTLDSNIVTDIKGTEMAKKEENNGVLGKLGMGGEVDSESAQNIDIGSNEFRNTNSDIITDVDVNKEDNTSVVKKVSKKEHKEENDGVLGKLGASDEADIESPKKIDSGSTPNSNIVTDVNANKKGNTRVVRKKVVKKVPKMVKKEDNDEDFGKIGVSSEADIESPKKIDSGFNEVGTSNSNIATDFNDNKEDNTIVVRKKVVTKDSKMVKKEETEIGVFEKKGVSDEAEITESPKKIVTYSNEFRNPNSNIVTEAKKEDKTRVVRKKVVKKGTKRVKMEENDADLEREEVSNAIECQNSDYDNDNTNEVHFDANINDNAGKIEKMFSVLTKGPKSVKKEEIDGELGRGKVSIDSKAERANVSEFQNSDSDIDNTSDMHDFDENIETNAGKIEKRKRVQKEECCEELGKFEMENETKAESSKINVLGAFQSTISDIDNCSASVALENINVDNNNTNKNEKAVRVVRKKVVKKVLKRVKKEQPFEELGTAKAVNEAEIEIPNAKKIKNTNSDIADSCASSLLEVENYCSDAVDDMLIEKGDGFHDDSADVNNNININANKEDNKVGSEGSERIEGEKHEAEIYELKRDFTMADDVVLSGEMEALERQKKRKTQIFLGGLDKDAMEEDVRKVFQEIGEIVELTVKMNEKSGKNKGFAFIRYASAADAKKAVEKSGKIEVLGKQCSVEFMKGNDTIYLGNIDKAWKNEDIVKLLRDVGVEKIDTVTVKADPENPERNLGYAFLEIETIRDAQIYFGLLEKKGFLGSKRIRVEWAKPLSEADEEEIHKVKTVYAEYLPASWDKETVKNNFKKFGEIENIVLARNLLTSKRKDFAFINYKSREAALACIKEFTHKPLHNEGSKVHVKVCLAKSTPKAKQVKHAFSPVVTISIKEKPNTAPTPMQLNQMRSKVVSTDHYYENSGVVLQPQFRKNAESSSHHCDNSRVTASTNNELVQLLREQASWRQPQTTFVAGPASLEYTRSLPATKRQYSYLGDDPIYSDLRGYSRPRTESAPAVNPRVMYPDLGNQSLPHYSRQGLSYPSGLPYEVDGYFNRSQTGGGASPGGGSGVYRRY